MLFQVGELAALGPCLCTTCEIGRALRSLQDGVDDWLNQDCERQMDLAFLIDEVQAAVKDPKMGANTRRRLLTALEIVGGRDV